MYFCEAGLEIEQTKGGPGALHPVSHSSSLRGNPWRDGSRLRHCALDAEHPVTSIALEGLIKVHGSSHALMCCGFAPLVSCHLNVEVIKMILIR